MTPGLIRFFESVVLLKAFEIITLIVYPDINRKLIKWHIVISTTTSKACAMLKLDRNEEILMAREMKHELVMNEQS